MIKLLKQLNTDSLNNNKTAVMLIPKTQVMPKHKLSQLHYFGANGHSSTLISRYHHMGDASHK